MSEGKSNELRVSPEWYEGEISPSCIPDPLSDLMEAFREKGLLTIDGESCCSTCAAHELSNSADEMDVPGFAYVHEQNLETMGDSVNVGFGGNNMETEEVGELLAETAEDEGFKVVWDGSASTKVEVVLF